MRRGARLLGSPLRQAERALLPTVTGVATAAPAVALTFDDGPHPDTTPRILALLEEHGARATFFVVGSQARRHPELLERIARGGHALGSHTLDHPSLPRLPGRERRRQIAEGAAALGPHTTDLFRPPFGHQSLASRLDAARLGCRVITWTGHCRDWVCQDPGELAVALRRQVVPGAIVLLHDALFVSEAPGLADRTALLAALREVLAATRGEYRYVTVPELLRLGRPVRASWRKRASEEWLDSLVPTPRAGDAALVADGAARS